MPSADDLSSLSRKRLEPDLTGVVPAMPPIPDDVKKRFSSMIQWEKDLNRWAQEKVAIAIRGGGP